MEPTILNDDYVMIQKFPNINPKRGELVVVMHPKIPNYLLFKRCAATAGETIEIKDESIFINGKIVSDAPFRKLKYLSLGYYGTNGKPYKIPDNSIFILGDYSMNSNDSRYFGAVPVSNLIGKPIKILWPLNRVGIIE